MHDIYSHIVLYGKISHAQVSQTKENTNMIGPHINGGVGNYGPLIIAQSDSGQITKLAEFSNA